MDPTTSRRRRRAKHNATTTLLVAAAFAAATSRGAVTVADLPVEVDMRTLGFKRRRMSNRDHWGSTWGVMVEKGTYRDATTPQGNKFQRRFRVTPEEYEDLVSEVREKGWWSCNATDAAGQPAAPVELLMLGVLRMLGRACTFDDLGQCCRLCCRLCCHPYARACARPCAPKAPQRLVPLGAAALTVGWPWMRRDCVRVRVVVQRSFPTSGRKRTGGSSRSTRRRAPKTSGRSAGGSTTPRSTSGSASGCSA